MKKEYTQRKNLMEELVRSMLLKERSRLSYQIGDRKRTIKKLSDEQKKDKILLSEVNRHLDTLGIRIHEK